MKRWLDSETVARTHIHDGFDENLRKELRAAGIDSSALPSWLGGMTSTGIPLLALINDTIRQGGCRIPAGFSVELSQKLARIQENDQLDNLIIEVQPPIVEDHRTRRVIAPRTLIAREEPSEDIQQHREYFRFALIVALVSALASIFLVHLVSSMGRGRHLNAGGSFFLQSSPSRLKD